MSEIDVIRSVNFDWAMRIADVWSDAAWDSHELHANVRSEFTQKLGVMRQNPAGGSPLGWVVVGSGGTGKTHLLGSFRREATRRKCAFVLVDMTDVRNFWESVLQGYIDSLQQSFGSEVFQYEWVLRNIIERLGPNKPVAQILSMLAERKSKDLQGDIAKVLSALSKVSPKETLKYQNTVRALICLNSDDFSISSLGMTWLQGQTLEEDEKKGLGFSVNREQPIKIVEALSWFMSLSGPMVLAFDQLDPIVTQLHYRKQGDPSTEEQATAESIIVEIGSGLGSLRDMTRNTLTVIACVESTWEILGSTVLRTFVDRFETPWRLSATGNKVIAQGIVSGRLQTAFGASGLESKYPTYPFRPEAFHDLEHDTPREILKKCDDHRRRCILANLVTELSSFTGTGSNGEQRGVGTVELDRLDQAFNRHVTDADLAELLDEKFEDQRLGPLLQTALECLLRETDLPPEVDSFVDTEFTGGVKTRPLHARLRLIFQKENEREEHYCVRALQLTNAKAYQARLKAAMTQSGIDRTLTFRRLTLVRTKPLPGGVETKKLTDKFMQAEGVFVHPTDDELRTIRAVHKLKSNGDVDFEKWLKARKPISGLKLVRDIVPTALFFPSTTTGKHSGPPSTPPAISTTAKVAPGDTGGDTAHREQPQNTSEVDPPAPTSDIPFGRRVVANKPGAPIGMAIKLLEKHTLVLAGAGSGKTVLLKRLIEESALLGIPSIVIDCANDLASLDEPWGSLPGEWSDEDREKAVRYHGKSEVILWTPGKEAGNPLSFEPLPDLAPLSHDEDELQTAVSMVVEALTPVVAAGHGQASENKRGILSKSLRYLAQHGGGRLAELIELLKDLPPEAGLGVAKEAKLAQQIADALKVALETNPLLRSQGAAFDPAILLGDGQPSDRVRISVINFVGLPGLEAQRYFLNQLAMNLFAWIKKNPDPGERPLRGLLVIDESKDFVPSQKASVCRESLVRLAAQARKYHLGLVFATQNPKDIDHRIVANCSTHFYGKVNSPAAIETVRGLIQGKGGSGDDVPKLSRGHFYFHNSDVGIPAPVKLVVPLCLSRHPSSPLDEASIHLKASKSRKTMRAFQISACSTEQ
jgi:Helicase HerA, central domain